MTPYYADDWLTVYLGDCREVMAAMEPESVHCVVTSPPYWGLRDYGTATWEGGDAECNHVYDRTVGMRASTLGGGKANQPAGSVYRTCPRCGAVRSDGQLGLEPTPELFVEAMVAVFREVRRVLRKDGTVWLNLGDSYAATPTGRHEKWSHGAIFDGRDMTGHHSARNTSSVVSGLKPKDLVGIPWRVAFALQADGWYLRSDIIWSKPNPMPESVTDRPTKAHEYVFLLSKSPRYYYDADAVREATAYPPGSGWEDAPRGSFNGKNDQEGSATDGAFRAIRAARNLRSVWNIATEPYPGAHFATFPRALVEPCIKAGTSAKGVCPKCGAPWVREVEREPNNDGYRNGPGGSKTFRNPDRNETADNGSTLAAVARYYVTTTGWRPFCAHGCEPVPATCLDPFAGSGTTGLVAQSLSRRAVLIDLSADYLEQLMDRNRDIPLGLAGG